MVQANRFRVTVLAANPVNEMGVRRLLSQWKLQRGQFHKPVFPSSTSVLVKGNQVTLFGVSRLDESSVNETQDSLSVFLGQHLSGQPSV
jgi:hypothetical protein